MLQLRNSTTDQVCVWCNDPVTAGEHCLAIPTNSPELLNQSCRNFNYMLACSSMKCCNRPNLTISTSLPLLCSFLLGSYYYSCCGYFLVCVLLLCYMCYSDRCDCEAVSLHAVGISHHSLLCPHYRVKGKSHATYSHVA